MTTDPQPTESLSIFVQDANGTVYELEPVKGVFWDHRASPFGQTWYFTTTHPHEPRDPRDRPLYRLVLPTEESST